MAKEPTIDLMGGFLVRWTDKDLQKDVPRRLKRALESAGAERAPLTRALLIRWLEYIEKNGPVPVGYAVGDVIERPEQEAGAQKSEVRAKKPK